MDIRAEKLQLIQQILQINDATIISSVKNLLAYGQKEKSENAQTISDFWEELNASQKAQIELAIKQLDDGQGIEHEKVMADFRKKYQ